MMLLIERVPLDYDYKALKVLSVCDQYGLKDQGVITEHAQYTINDESCATTSPLQPRTNKRSPMEGPNRSHLYRSQ